MLVNRRTTIALLAFAFLMGGLFLGSLSFIPEASALDAGVNIVDASIDLSGTDIRVIIARIIRVALGLLGVIALGLVLYGGFVWMTAGGDEEKVNTAKRILTNAFIGLVIVLTSFAITQFVLNKLVEATTGVSVVGDGDDGGGGLPIGAFAVSSITPQNPAPPRGFPKNAVVRIRMNSAVDPATVPGNVSVYVSDDDTFAPGDFDVNGSLIRFVPSASCDPDPGSNCFSADTTFAVEVKSGLRSTSGKFVTCGGLAPNCSISFTTGNYIDTEDPLVGMTVPSNMQSVRPDFETMRALASDDAGLAEVEFFDNSVSVEPPASPLGAMSFEATTVWDTGELAPQSCRALKATAVDFAENDADSQPVNVVVRPWHCFDGTQNEGETGLDCGGDALSLDYCGKCAGESCVSIPEDACELFCRSGSCVSGTCVDLPRIDNVAPLAAGPGSYVTIIGEFFGGASGTVTFLGGNGPEDDVAATLAPCTAAWTPTQIIVLVPDDEALITGPIKVGTAIGDDTTADDRGFVGNFTPNTALLPGLCDITPLRGESGAGFTLRGNAFGSSQGSSEVRFGTREATSISTWGNALIAGAVPTITAGPVDVLVTVSGEQSNPVLFTVLGPEAGEDPVITDITPGEGPAGTFVTISGTNFGRIGQVIFTNPVSGGTAIGDTNFPEGCEGNFWNNYQITVKVPESYSSGAEGDLELIAHDIAVRRSGVSEATSNRMPFVVNGKPRAPGLCGLSPVSGPENTPVRFFGDAFGNTGNTITKFYSSITSAVTWARSDEVRASVPVGAESGPVVVQVTGNESNPRDFRVVDCREVSDACEVGFECCSNGACSVEGTCSETVSAGGYAWYFSTGPIPQVPRLVYECSATSVPSPAPYSSRAGGEDVCVNALITGRFSIPMEVSTVNAGNVEISSCIEDEDGELQCDTDVSGSFSSFEWGSDAGAGHGFMFVPDALLIDNWYEIRVRTGIQGSAASGGVSLIEDSSCGSGFAYCWQFKTRDSTSECPLGSVQVEPFNKIATSIDQVIPYIALARAAGDICLMIRPTSDFNWTATDPDGRASVAPVEGLIAGIHDKSDVTTLAETPDENPVDIRASVLSGGEPIAGAGLLTIDFTDPEVVEWAPNCEQACINTGLKIRFNTAMAPIDAGDVTLSKCRNESCVSLSNEVPLTNFRLNTEEERGIPPGYILRIDTVGDLTPQTFYRVVLSGDVQSTSGVGLVGENYGPDFSWAFRTKNDATKCAIASVGIVPESATVDVVYGRAQFSAIPLGSPDECSATGQELVARDYDWAWTEQNRMVAYFWNFRSGFVNTTTVLPVGCSSQCLLTGARGIFGRAAVCGNSILETTLGEECDDGNVINGDGCSNICLNEGSVGGATCGNGGACVEDDDCDGSGESCDLDSLTCVEDSEDCDDGMACTDGTPCTTALECTDIGNGTCAARDNDGCSHICLNEGATTGLSECGNGSIGIGEDCDDGNRTGGDGCSARCLAEGSRSAPFALCGNGRIESGEECDGGSGCDSTTCLRIGSVACTTSGQLNCCGNGNKEVGEDCDDRNSENGDGCSARCLSEGSSAFYPNMNPIFCGDGVRQYRWGNQIEECESVSRGDGKIDPTQIAIAYGYGAVVDGKQTSEVYATAQGVRGTATFNLACGFTDDKQCRDTRRIGWSSGYQNFGVGANSCCYPRPTVVRTTPAIDEGQYAEADGDPIGVCRNPLIRLDFNRAMDTGTFVGNVLVAKESSTDCPAGREELLALDELNTPVIAVQNVWQRAKYFLTEFTGIAFAAHAPPADPSAQPGGPGAWCLGEVVGRAYGVDNPGDLNNPDDDTSSLFFEIQNGALDPLTWYRVRVVGDDYVSATQDGVRSKDGVGMASDYEWKFFTGNDICTADLVRVIDETGMPSLFNSAAEDHTFTATAYTRRGAEESPIVPVTGVYDWNWVNWNSSAEDIVSVSRIDATDVDPQTATITSQNKNGSAQVSAQLKIVTDTLLSESTVDDRVRGALSTTVFICENHGLVVEDIDGNSDGLEEPFGNFRTRYCRDAEGAGAADDLPMVRVQSVASPPGGILKEFVLRYDDTDTWGNDAIGFRMVENSRHLSAMRWYAQQGFTGTPTPLMVDGYDAVRDGRTVYVNAANLGADGNLYSNIYVISYNEGARPEMLVIYDQLLENMVFNVNLSDIENTNMCEPSGAESIACTADVECDGTCSSQKEKIRRDTRRLADMHDIEQMLAVYRCREREGSMCVGTYPTLQGGTFIRSMTVSAWPSWLETLATEMGVALPIDPLNRFEDCADGYDDATCFASSAVSGCPAGGCYQCTSGSHVYEYKSAGPNAYQLSADLEYTAHEWADVLMPMPFSVGATLLANQDAPFMCEGSVVGESEECGDGIVGGGEACELGQTSFESCVFAPGATGQVITDCNAICSGFEPRAGAVCVAEFCGDGVIQLALGEVCDDGVNNGFYGFCAHDCGVGGTPYSAYCGDSTLAGIEQCDRGADNGQWTRDEVDSCAWDCSFPGPYCGDEITNGSEACDGNTQSGAGRCVGDTSRPCDYDTDCAIGDTCNVSSGTFCADQYRCSRATNISCTPPGPGIADPCLPSNGLCTRYPMARTRTCVASCSWGATSGCAPAGGCGDNIVQGGEECDDANDNNNDGCTNACRLNVCGDGFPWTDVEQCDFGGENGTPCVAPYGSTCNYCSGSCLYVTQTGAFCGDGVVSGPESCDGTAEPIILDPSNPPLGYDPTTSLCSMSCRNVCPGDFQSIPIRFVEPTRSTEYVFTGTGETNKLAIPPSRIGAGLAIDTDFGDNVIHFPSPMDVLFVLDDSGSMRASRRRSLKTALCGTDDCSALNSNGAIQKLLESPGREPGDVRIGVIAYGDKSMYLTHELGAHVTGRLDNNNSCDRNGDGNYELNSQDYQVPCYDRDQYLGPDNRLGGGDDSDPLNIDVTGLLSDNPINRTKLRQAVGNLLGQSGGTRSWLALKQAKKIMDASDARSKVVIFMSDGEANDCCSGVAAGGQCGGSYINVRHCTNGGSCQATSGFDCAFSDTEAATMNQPDDDVYIFTVLFSDDNLASMERWADDASGDIGFAYAGSNASQLFSDILSVIGVRLQIANNTSFDNRSSNWMDEVTVAEPGFNISLQTPRLNARASSDWQEVFVKALYGTTGSDDDVTISNPRWNFCPLGTF